MATKSIGKALVILATLFLCALDSLAQENFNFPAYTQSKTKGADYLFVEPSELNENVYDEIRLLKSDTLLAAGYKDLTEATPYNQVNFLFDATLGSFFISAGAQTLEEFEILNAKGEPLDFSEEDFLTYSFKNQRIVSGNMKQAGPFTARIKGSGNSAITVRGKLKAATVGYNFKPVVFEFGQMEEYLRYTQYRAIKRPIKAGEDLICNILVKSPTDKLQFGFANQAGQVIDWPKLKFRSKKRQGMIFRGPCKVPTEPFRYIVYRTGESGRIGQR